MKKMSNEMVERYLRNELTAQELSDFTFQLVMNPSLRQEVEATRTVFRTLKTTNASGGTSVSSMRTKQLNILAIAGIVILAIAAFFFLQKGTTTEDTPPPTELILPAERPANVPIAEAFTRNPFIENAMSTRDLPTGSFDLFLDKKMLHFSGNGLTKTNQAKVTVYNNQQSDFVEERFVFAKDIQISADGKIDFSIKNLLSPGLYYFDFSIANSTVKIGSFEVK